MKYSKLNQFIAISALSSLLVFPTSSQAAVLVYEGFQYDTPGTAGLGGSGSPIVGNPNGDPGDVDATGLAGTYTGSLDTNSATLRLKPGSLGTSGRFSGLTTTGNHIGTDTSNNNTIASRTTSVALNGAGDLWFSLVMRPVSTNSASDGGFAITTEAVTGSGQIPSVAGSLTLDGVAIASNGNQNWRAFAWDGGVLSQSNAELATVNNENYLMVGHVSFDSSGGSDVFQLYEFTGAVGGGGSLNAIGSAITIDMDQSAFDTINFTRQRLAGYDELRIATTLDEALGLTVAVVPEPSAIVLFGMGGLMGLLVRRRRD